MEYRSETIVIDPEDDIPQPAHDDRFYNHIEWIKHKGRRKKADPIKFKSTFIPWDDLNNTELVELCAYTFLLSDKRRYGHHPASRKGTTMWRVVGRHLPRTTLIALIIEGIEAAKDLDNNPTHRARCRLQNMFYNEWKYINSQIQCSTYCWECSDVKALECELENHALLTAEERS